MSKSDARLRPTQYSAQLKCSYMTSLWVQVGTICLDYEEKMFAMDRAQVVL